MESSCHFMLESYFGRFCEALSERYAFQNISLEPWASSIRVIYWAQDSRADLWVGWATWVWTIGSENRLKHWLRVGLWHVG
ncbi:hypothetical protein CFP56_028088 [Quercus suber]|uniref:Uncharacterized protein n=1 Tax=Quercus suber TaxID=58331 RepID=A0AAW0JWC8_QUESU